MTVLTGTAYWTHIAAPATGGKYPSGRYEITLGNLDAANIAAIKGMGMGKYLKEDPKNPNQGTQIRLKAGTNKKTGEPVRPALINSEKEDYPSTQMVGNGSKVKCQVSTYSTQNGTFLDLRTIMVMDLVEYNGVDLSEFDKAIQELDPYAVE